MSNNLSWSVEEEGEMAPEVVWTCRWNEKKSISLGFKGIYTSLFGGSERSFER